MSAPPLPVRPRLAEHALVRRHVVDGVEMVVIHDARSGDLVRMGPREWDLVAGADGTRDFDALALAAAQKGAYRRASELGAALSHLHAAGLLADGIAHPAPVDTGDAKRRLDVLAGYSLTCDGSGSCCAMYGSVLFSPLEAARARSVCPEVRDGGNHPERAFTPEHGARPDGALAVALIDGRCAYLGDDGRCALHVAGGEQSKPRGCRVYPATFVDDGEALRVSVGVECACVLASVGKDGGAPLVDAGAETRGDLGAVRVVVLPETIAITAAASAARATFAAWSSAVVEVLPAIDDGAADPVALLWSMARAIEAHGLDVEATRAAIQAPSGPTQAEIATAVAALIARAEARVETADAWRGARDRSRLVSHWIAAAARALRDADKLDAALVEASFRRDELFFLHAQVHGRLLAGEAPLAVALRDRALRLLLARALAPELPPSEPSRAHPLSLVEVMMRGHGMSAYTQGV